MAGNDYSQAVDAVFSVVEIAADKIPNSKVRAAVKAVNVAKPIVKKAAPVVAAAAKPAVDKAKQAAPDVAHKAGQVAGKAGHAVASAAGVAKGNVVRAASSAKGRVAGAVKGAAGKRKEKLSQAEARRRLLEYAPVKVAASDLSRSNENELDIALQGFLHYPGCYAAVTYGTAGKGKDLAKYREAHVFYAEDMGAAMAADIEGRGSYDVYADVKYDQGVVFFLYPCSAEDAKGLMGSLAEVLVEDDAGTSADGDAGSTEE